jgi:hypothetical protein
MAPGLSLNVPILVALLKRCGANLQSLDIWWRFLPVKVPIKGPVVPTVGEFKFVCFGFLFKLKLNGYEILLFPC